MSAAVELVLLWHYHQPDYRDPKTGRARLPWVRLHAAKDYLDMASRLSAASGVSVTFNFVPSLVDQLEGASRDEPDDLFERLALDPATLDLPARRDLARRCVQVPGHARERWAGLRRALEAARDPDPGQLLALEIWFLLAWIDPIFLGDPAAARAMAAEDRFELGHRDQLLALHRSLTKAVIPAYRELASLDRIELSASPYYHPILPLLLDVGVARRAQPGLPLPREPFEAPEDAQLQLARALERHRQVFGRAAAGVWPSEGSVSPEVAALAASQGVRWLASDEAVLFRSLPPSARARGAHYRPWVLETASGPAAFFFRDHELSDRIGFVYQRWDPADAVGDFVGRLRRIGQEHAGGAPPVVAVILDGENCWEGYPEDGGPFLDLLYRTLAESADIRTTTPSRVLELSRDLPRLSNLHTGSWIDADLHVWVGHPEKNRAWELLSRARRFLSERPEREGARDSLLRAEGSDWFWWFGDDHYTEDKEVFDDLFRSHLRAVYEQCGEPAPALLEVPIGMPGFSPGRREPPIAFLTVNLDGRDTHFYEWQPAGRLKLDGDGSAMHAGRGLVKDLYYGFDRARFYLRLDFTETPPPSTGLRLELLEPAPGRMEVRSLAAGTQPVEQIGDAGARGPVPGARCSIGSVLEMSVPIGELDWKPGESVQLRVQILDGGRPVATLPEGGAVRFDAPDESFDVSAWAP